MAQIDEDALAEILRLVEMIGEDEAIRCLQVAANVQSAMAALSEDSDTLNSLMAPDGAQP